VAVLARRGLLLSFKDRSGKRQAPEAEGMMSSWAGDAHSTAWRLPSFGRHIGQASGIDSLEETTELSLLPSPSRSQNHEKDDEQNRCPRCPRRCCLDGWSSWRAGDGTIFPEKNN